MSVLYTLQNKKQQLSKELDDQKVKIDRVMKQIARYAKELRASRRVKGETHEEVCRELSAKLAMPFKVC